MNCFATHNDDTRYIWDGFQGAIDFDWALPVLQEVPSTTTDELLSSSDSLSLDQFFNTVDDEAAVDSHTSPDSQDCAGKTNTWDLPVKQEASEVQPVAKQEPAWDLPVKQEASEGQPVEQEPNLQSELQPATLVVVAEETKHPKEVSLVEHIEINETSTVREDKSNTVRIYFNNKFPQLKEAKEVSFRGLTLGVEDNSEQVRKEIHGVNSGFQENILYLFFSLNPNFGRFKSSLQPDALAKVQKVSLVDENTVLEVKVMFTKSLRPGHCLTEEFQKKKNNFMNLHALLAFKPLGEDHWYISSSKEPFWFRSNGGRSNPTHVTKRKLAESDTSSSDSDSKKPVRKRQKTSKTSKRVPASPDTPRSQPTRGRIN